MKNNHSFCIVLGLVFVYSCNNSFNGEDKQDSLGDSLGIKNNIGNPDGQWTSKFSTIDYSGCKNFTGKLPEALSVNTPEVKNWIIKGDSIWELCYPYQFYGAHLFKIKGDSVYLDNSVRAYAAISWKNTQEFSLNLLGDIKCASKTECFRRDSLSVTDVRTLIRDSVNFEITKGKYSLVKEIETEDGNHSDIRFPVRIPESIQINEQLMKTLWRERKIDLAVDGQSRLFYLENTKWNNYDGSYSKAVQSDWILTPVITLRPGDWWKGEDFTVSYVRE